MLGKLHCWTSSCRLQQHAIGLAQQGGGLRPRHHEVGRDEEDGKGYEAQDWLKTGPKTDSLLPVSVTETETEKTKLNNIGGF
jgi:hypothetical protein